MPQTPPPLDIEPIACLRDNYAWLVRHSRPPLAQRPAEVVLVDPGEAEPILRRLDALEARVAAVLITHHHEDHIGGLAGLTEHPRLAGATVYASAYDCAHGRVLGAVPAAAGRMPELLQQEVVPIETPGHTRGHVCYFWPAARAVFTGDTLFLAGCGRLFEGTAEQMLASLQALSGLPEDTGVYCGHEYTAKNLAFAAAISPDDAGLVDRLQRVRARIAAGQPTVPAPLAEELATNPFLRTAEPLMMAKMDAATPIDCLRALRGRRDSF